MSNLSNVTTTLSNKDVLKVAKDLLKVAGKSKAPMGVINTLDFCIVIINYWESFNSQQGAQTPTDYIIKSLILSVKDFTKIGKASMVFRMLKESEDKPVVKSINNFVTRYILRYIANANRKDYININVKPYFLDDILHIELVSEVIFDNMTSGQIRVLNDELGINIPTSSANIARQEELDKQNKELSDLW